MGTNIATAAMRTLPAAPPLRARSKLSQWRDCVTKRNRSTTFGSTRMRNRFVS